MRSFNTIETLAAVLLPGQSNDDIALVLGPKAQALLDLGLFGPRVYLLLVIGPLAYPLGLVPSHISFSDYSQKYS